MAKKRTRKKYDLREIIHFYKLDESFEVYKANNDLKRHLSGKKVLSFNRLARAFLRMKEAEERKSIGAVQLSYFNSKFEL